MVKILVTGGNGFLGGMLAKELSKRKSYEVTVFDRNSAKPLPGVRYISGDITEPEDVRKAVENQDYVYHLAAVLSEKNPKLLYDVNFGGTVSVLEACKNEKIKKMIYVSTAGVMEETAEEADEKTPYGPKTPYEKSKTMAEKAVREYQKRHKIPITIIRPALVYGPNMYWKSILEKAEESFPVIGSGKNMWHMIYVKNLIEVLVNARARAEPGEIYVVADKKVYTYGEMYKIILEELGIRKKPVHIPVFVARFLSVLYRLRKNENLVNKSHIDRLLKNKIYDISKAKVELKYDPKYDFREGIRETIKYFRVKGLLKR